MPSNPAAERIAAALRDLARAEGWGGVPLTHPDDCWMFHSGCLATRIRRTLTGEDPTNA